MVDQYIDFITCAILPDTSVLLRFLKRRSLLMESYALEKSTKHVYRYIPFFTDFLISEISVKI